MLPTLSITINKHCREKTFELNTSTHGKANLHLQQDLQCLYSFDFLAGIELSLTSPQATTVPIFVRCVQLMLLDVTHHAHSTILIWKLMRNPTRFHCFSTKGEVSRRLVCGYPTCRFISCQDAFARCHNGIGNVSQLFALLGGEGGREDRHFLQQKDTKSC